MDQQVVTSATFYEELPQESECPPRNTIAPGLSTLWRLACSSHITALDFQSERLKNPTRKFKDECGGASISLVPTYEQAVAAVKTPLMKKKNFTHAVAVTYDSKAGVWHLDKPSHCHFWPYAGFDFTKIIGEVRKLI